MWQSYKPLVTIYIIVPPFVNSSLLENSYFAVLYPFTSYVKLQDAYVSEAGEYYGSWAMIGYTMKSTTNFKFLEGTTENGVAAATSSELPASAALTWSAKSNAALNDCNTNSLWNLSVKKNTGNGAGALYEAAITGGPTGKCVILTPSFGKLSNEAVKNVAAQ